MATTEKTQPVAVKKTKKNDAPRVELFIPRGAKNEEKTEFISVNGENYFLPKGKTSMVPPYVKAEYERSLLAEAHLDETVDSLISKEPTV